MKTLRQILKPGEGYAPVPKGEQRFVAKHEVQVTDPTDDKVADSNEPLFTGSKQKSVMDNPGRHGYSPEKAKSVYEQTEITEVSKAVLGRYVKKANSQTNELSAYLEAGRDYFSKKRLDNTRKFNNRNAGIDKAVDKLTKKKSDE